MKIPNLKRIKVSSETELATWLSKRPKQFESVMITTTTKPSGPNFVGRDQVEAALAAHGWIAGPCFTLNGGLIGHVISQSDQ